MTKSGRERYPKRAPVPGAAEGLDLGPPMSPQDILAWLRPICGLDDTEMLTALLAGADRVERDMGSDPVRPDAPALGELSLEERQDAVDQARDVTRSRLMAWRKRARHMTWLELRVMLVGLRETA